jgi:molecular chaperone GrpE (heat shock protein)
MNKASPIVVPELHKNIADKLSNIAVLLECNLKDDARAAQIWENNYYLLKLVLSSPTIHPRDYQSILSHEHNIVMEVDPYTQLRTDGLASVERRERFVRIMSEIGLKTYRLIMNKSQNPFEDFDGVARIIRAKIAHSNNFRFRRIEGKGYLTFLTSLPDWPKDPSYKVLNELLSTLKNIATKGSYKLCYETARRLVDVIGEEYGFEKRKTSKERVESILQDIDSSTQNVDDLRSSLLLVQQEFQHLKEEFDQEIESFKQDFIRGFFARMNSARSGHLLDAMAQTGALIRENREKGEDLPRELQAIPMMIQIFMSMLKAEGITPIETVGKVKEIQARELSKFEFVGSSNFASNDIISAVVRTPGWQFGQAVISKPRIEEIIH